MPKQSRTRKKKSKQQFKNNANVSSSSNSETDNSDQTISEPEELQDWSDEDPSYNYQAEPKCKKRKTTISDFFNPKSSNSGELFLA